MFADLRPYICIMENCQVTAAFGSQTEFEQHLATHAHIDAILCPVCNHTEQDIHRFKRHFRSAHPSETITSAVKPTKVPRDLNIQPCPFCAEIPGSKNFVRHVSRHCEEVALSSLSQTFDEDSDDGNASEIASLPIDPDDDAGDAGDSGEKDENEGNGDSGDANAEEEWGFAPAKARKKGKKGKVDPEPDPEPAPAKASTTFDAFHKIKLDDTGPMLDLSFGPLDTKTSGGGGGFGAWSSSWNTGTTTTWDFSSTTAAAEAKSEDTAIDNNPWSINRGKPKKENTSFSFGALDEPETKEEDEEKPEKEEKKEDNDFGFGFTPIGKKEKKKKKGGMFDFDDEKKEEPKKDQPPPVIEEPAKPDAIDDWGGGWGTTSKTKKKNGKKAEPEPVPEPAKEEPKEEFKTSFLDDDWGFRTTKKEKKKGKAAIEEVTKVEEPVVAEKAESVVEEDDVGSWGSWGLAKKDKKKNAKAKEESPEPIVESTALTKALEPAANDDWMNWVGLLVSLVLLVF